MDCVDCRNLIAEFDRAERAHARVLELLVTQAVSADSHDYGKLALRAETAAEVVQKVQSKLDQHRRTRVCAQAVRSPVEQRSSGPVSL